MNSQNDPAEPLDPVLHARRTDPKLPVEVEIAGCGNQVFDDRLVLDHLLGVVVDMKGLGRKGLPAGGASQPRDLAEYFGMVESVMLVPFPGTGRPKIDACWVRAVRYLHAVLLVSRSHTKKTALSAPCFISTQALVHY